MPSTTESSSWLVVFRCIHCINNKLFFFMWRTKHYLWKMTARIWSKFGSVIVDEFADSSCLPSWLLLLRSINPKEGGGSSHGIWVTSGTPPERGMDVKPLHGFKRRQQHCGQEVFWGGISSAQWRNSLSWNRWKNIEENYHVLALNI